MEGEPTLVPQYQPRRLTKEDLIKDVSQYPDDTIPKRAARLGFHHSIVYRLIAKEGLKGLLSKDKNVQQQLIARLKEAGNRIKEFEEEQMVAGIEDAAMLRAHNDRMLESTLNPLKQAKSILYHSDRLLMLLVGDIDRKLKMMTDLYEKQIRGAAEFTDTEKKNLEEAIYFFGNINSTIKSVERLTNSVSRAWEIVLEYQSKDMIQPATIIDILARRLKLPPSWETELPPDAAKAIPAVFGQVLELIIGDFQQIQRENTGR